MAFEFDGNAMFKACALYLSKGLVLVRVHGIWPNGRCTCGKSSHVVDISTFAKTPMSKKCGKHPVGDDWASHCARSEDDILRWLDDGIPFNVGALMGPSSGHIDSEDDDAVAKAFRESIGMDTLDTPTWTSGKSMHQLTKWHDSLSSCKGSLKVGGLEVRTGAGDRSIQSILPPSWHWSGVQYKWKPGFSIEDSEIAETPKTLLTAIVNGIDGVSRPASEEEPARNILFTAVHDGEGRHRKMLRWAWYKVVSVRNPDSRLNRENTLQELLLLNEHRLIPKKTHEEIVAIHESCLEHYRRRCDAGWRPTDDDMTEKGIEKAAAEIESGDGESESVPVSGFTEQGLEPHTVGSEMAYKPGAWRIQMIQSDPIEIVLCVPAWSRLPCRGRVSLSLDDFRSASKVAAAVFNATRRVMLDANPSKWKKIWHGQEPSKRTGGQCIPGLAEQLISRKNKEDDIVVGVSSLRFATLAGYVLQAFKKATQPKSEEKPEPNESGRPCWVKPDELWFQWSKVWEDISRLHDVAPGERNRVRGRLLRMMGQDDFVHGRHRFSGGRMEYVIFDRNWIECVERLASGDDSSDLDGNRGENAREKCPDDEKSTVQPSIDCKSLLDKDLEFPVSGRSF